ncbi:MAG TPA: DUF2892 domain-containing protein [Candidatus Nanopelagicaceae bacterium]|nr:DUF2892 domain-containing protein [Candidatus Nanopelagicaceae bacterium]
MSRKTQENPTFKAKKVPPKSRMVGVEDRLLVNGVAMEFAKFMSGSIGRGVRVLAGLALIIWGSTLGSTAGVILAIVGAVVLLAGAFNFCLFAPIFGGPLSGKAFRSNS